jgi:3-oxoacyl-[acyl-carrier protein] reductase
MRLENKVAIVTGGSRGIGRGIAESLAREGARVVVNYTRSELEAESAARAFGGLAVRADVSDPRHVTALFETAEHEFGGIDILVNNAGVAVFKPLAETTDEDFELVFGVNTRGAFYCLREAARRLRNGGRIVNMSTGATVHGTPGGSIYCGSKAALQLFTRCLARELGDRQITVNTVSPGFTDTDMLRQFPHLVDIAPSMSPLGRVGQVEDVARVVTWLCTPDADWMTGQNIQAGGGASMA